MNKYEKILHWLILLAFLGLCATALAAEYFFSKEAILDSFKKSLPMINATIAPVDQSFVSRIARRDTWDVHLYIGLAFFVFLIVWFAINLIRRNKRYLVFKTVFFASAFVFCISGVWMWLRLYVEVSEEAFSLLKKVHYYAYWAFIYTLIVHIAMVIWLENNKKRGILSNMINFKSIAIIALLYGLFSGQNLHADNGIEFEKWANDDNYINGVMYLEGEKGAEVLLKEISNCPYEKCKAKDIDQTQFGTKLIEIKKPDFKKGIALLKEASNNGNVLATEKLLTFLMQRVDYKSYKPSGYLVKLLEEETGLKLQEYKDLINKSWKNGVTTKKSCLSYYIAGDFAENGILNNTKDLEDAKEYYEEAIAICPQSNISYHMAQSRLLILNKK